MKLTSYSIVSSRLAVSDDTATDKFLMFCCQMMLSLGVNIGTAGRPFNEVQHRPLLLVLSHSRCPGSVTDIHTTQPAALDPAMKEGSPDGKRGPRACNGSHGETAPWMRNFLAFEYQTEVAKLHSFPYFAVSEDFMGVQYYRLTDRKGTGGGLAPLNVPLSSTCVYMFHIQTRVTDILSNSVYP